MPLPYRIGKFISIEDSARQCLDLGAARVWVISIWIFTYLSSTQFISLVTAHCYSVTDIKYVKCNWLGSMDYKIGINSTVTLFYIYLLLNQVNSYCFDLVQCRLNVFAFYMLPEKPIYPVIVDTVQILLSRGNVFYLQKNTSILYCCTVLNINGEELRHTGSFVWQQNWIWPGNVKWNLELSMIHLKYITSFLNVKHLLNDKTTLI